MSTPAQPDAAPPDLSAPPGDLVLGPVLRRVEGSRATIWVETGHPATVRVHAGPAGGSARTFSVHGHHYALVVVDGLPPAATTPYRLEIDGKAVWPLPDDPYPPPVIRTRQPGDPVRILFGSCREATPYSQRRYPPDALDAYAVRLSAGAAAWPDLLALLGDQVYADLIPGNVRRWLRRRRRRPKAAPATHVVSFHEYTKLYLDSWTDPEVRWLLSTVPSVMIFDDHEIIDDWNSSDSWRRDIAREPWWAKRIQAGLSSYWVYQHLGNLAPDALADDPVYAALSEDSTAVLEDFGSRADRERDAYRWSYTLDVDRTRLIVLDNRAGRHLEPGRRSMLADETWTWLTKATQGDYDHLVIGSSLPWLLPPAIHHLEAVSERLAESPRPLVVRVAEKVRRAGDLEHWAAFGRSFEALAALLGQVGSGAGAPASISVLSGDVHHSYAARADVGVGPTSPIHQLTCSPVHNDVPRLIRPVMRWGWNRTAARTMRAWARAIGLRKSTVRWRKDAGPYFGNAVAQLVHNGRSATVLFEGTGPDPTLRRLSELDLTGS